MFVANACSHGLINLSDLWEPNKADFTIPSDRKDDQERISTAHCGPGILHIAVIKLLYDHVIIKCKTDLIMWRVR